MEKLKAPFPWFGGKSRAADVVWRAFGDVRNYVEPFAGSLAVLLGRPHAPGVETVNDLDGYVSNFWRSMTKDPEAVAHWADWPVNECDLHARHVWLVQQKERFVPRLMGDPDFFDARVAGFWVWGISSWIGSGFCSSRGPWWPNERGELVKGDAGQGINRKRPHLGNAGQGINRKRPHLGDAETTRARHWIMALADRLRNVRVACGDWSRVCAPATTTHVSRDRSVTGVFLDPPYSVTDRDDCYVENSATVGADVWRWAVENGSNPLLRIAVCDYEDGRDIPPGWSVHCWSSSGAFAGGSERARSNAKRERIWFSPHCLPAHPSSPSAVLSPSPT